MSAWCTSPLRPASRKQSSECSDSLRQRQSYAIVGSPKRSRTSRSIAASRARANASAVIAAAKARELLVGLARQRRRAPRRPARRAPAAAAPRRAPPAARSAPARVARAGRPPSRGRRRARADTRSMSASNSAPSDPRARADVSRSSDALEVRRQRRRSAPGELADCRLSTATDRLTTAVTPSRPPPLVEHVEHVGFAEVDPHRPAARTLAVVALEIPIDARERDLERHALRRPARDEVERRPDDADQVPVVLLAEVGFDLAAVICNLQSAISICNRLFLIPFPHDSQAVQASGRDRRAR